MHFSTKLALRAGVLSVAAASAIVIPATAAFAAAPALGVAPDTGLKDNTSVAVTGSNFPATTNYFLSQCSGTGGQADCDVANATGGTTAADGSFSTTYHVQTGKIGNGNCNPGSTNCFLVATTNPASPDPTTNTAIHPLAFAAVPSITVKPSKGIHDGDKVKVTGKNFKPSSAYAVVACASKTDQTKCDTSDGDIDVAHQQTSASGGFTIKLPVYAKGTKNGTCKLGGKCYVAATTDISGLGKDRSQSATARIHLVGATAKTKTSAKAHGSKVTGKVKAGKKGVKGLKVTLDLKHGKHWKKVDSSKTKNGGKFSFAKLSSGKYEVKTPKQTKGGKTYGGSHSKPVHVKAGGSTSNDCPGCTFA
jgi:hypothetical protein